MIIAAALCPSPPLLVRELTGADPVLPDLREACAAAVGALVAARPEVIVVVGPGADTIAWPAEGRLNIATFGGRAARPAGTAGPAPRPPGRQRGPGDPPRRCRCQSGLARTCSTRAGTRGPADCTR